MNTETAATAIGLTLFAALAAGRRKRASAHEPQVVRSWTWTADGLVHERAEWCDGVVTYNASPDDGLV